MVKKAFGSDRKNTRAGGVTHCNLALAAASVGYLSHPTEWF